MNSEQLLKTCLRIIGRPRLIAFAIDTAMFDKTRETQKPSKDATAAKRGKKGGKKTLQRYGKDHFVKLAKRKAEVARRMKKI